MASLARAALASAGAGGRLNCPAFSPSRLTASVPTGLSSLRVPPSGIFSKSAGSREANAAVAKLPCGRIHLAARVGRQGAAVRPYPVRVTVFIAIGGMRRDGHLGVGLGQASTQG